MVNQDGSNLVFVVGAPRSGTTWAQRLIASHALIETGQESNLFLFYITPLLDSWKREPEYFDERGPNGLCCYVNEEEYIQSVRNFALSLLKNVEIPTNGFFLEKTTSHVCSTSDILKIFPKTKIILVHRHPFEVITSLINAGTSWGSVWAPKSIEDACRMWRKYAKCTIDTIKNIPKESLEVVSFDEIRSEPVETMLRVFNFLSLGSNKEECLKIYENNKPGGPDILKIPFYGQYDGRFIEEPDGFYKKQDKAPKTSFFRRRKIYKLVKDEMLELGYSMR